MVEEPRFVEIAKKARAKACKFIDTIPSLKMAEVSRALTGPNENIGLSGKVLLFHLLRFAETDTRVKVCFWNQFYDPKKRFWSWLSATDSASSFKLHLSASQLTYGVQKTGISKEQQAIRCIIHEIAHLDLNHCNITENGVPIPSVSSENEEEAWVYTFIFLSVLLGDYAKCQQNANKCDDTVIVPV